MTQSEYDALVRDIAAEPPVTFPGVSQTLRDALSASKELSARWRQASARSPVGGLLLCPRWPSDVRENLLTHCEASTWQRLQLQPHSPVFNAGILFGNAGLAGVLEATREAGVVVLGLEHLAPALADRWLIHLRVWWQSRPDQTGTPPHLLHLAERDSHAARCLVESGLLAVVSLPALASRPQDIPFVLHAEASTRGGGLTDFEPNALNILIRHPWPGDWLETRALVNHLYDKSAKDVPISFDGDDVRRGLDDVAALSASGEILQRISTWDDLRKLGAQCDTVTYSILDKPFFHEKTFDENPLSQPIPELMRSRLVSWSYKTFHDRDGSADNLKAVLKLPLVNDLSSKDIQEFCELIQNWRTLEQHSRESSPRGEEMRRRVAKWCEKACDSDSPGDSHWERCVARLLLDLRHILSLILERLQAISTAPDAEMLAAQWRERLDMSWPKHKHDRLLDRVLQDLGRTELQAEAIGKVLLPAMQTQVAFYSPHSDRERHMRAWLEDEIQRRFPHPPIISDDLIHIGVPPAKVDYWLRHCNRLHREQGKDRDELISLVTNELIRLTGADRPD